MISISTDRLNLRFRTGTRGDEIFDPVRRRWVVLTPEEWVRQTLLGFLLETMEYPSALMAVERGIRLGEMQKRFDIMVFGRNGKPWMLIECKAPGQSIESKAVGQMLAYQTVVGASFLVLANGETTRCWTINNGSVNELEAFPAFNG